MANSIDSVKTDFGSRLTELETQYTTQQEGKEFYIIFLILFVKAEFEFLGKKINVKLNQKALRKLTTEAGDKFAQLTSELRDEITKSRERERTISEELEELVVQQDDFMRTTRSRLYELAELEENSSQVLEQIQKNDQKNSQKVKFIENYEKETEDRLKGHENEIRMLTKMINSKFLLPKLVITLFQACKTS